MLSTLITVILCCILVPIVVMTGVIILYTIYETICNTLGIGQYNADKAADMEANKFVNDYVARQDKITRDNEQFEALQNDRDIKDTLLANRLEDARTRNDARRKYLLQDMFKRMAISDTKH